MRGCLNSETWHFLILVSQLKKQKGETCDMLKMHCTVFLATKQQSQIKETCNGSDNLFLGILIHTIFCLRQKR